MKQWMAVVGFAAIAAASLLSIPGCGEDEATCAPTTPSSCPSSPPSYKDDVAPIVEKYCGKCHVEGGESADKPLDTYQGMSALIDLVSSEISGCEMPPADETQPSDAEREKVLAWIVCGGKDD